MADKNRYLLRGDPGEKTKGRGGNGQKQTNTVFEFNKNRGGGRGFRKRGFWQKQNAPHRSATQGQKKEGDGA